MLDEPTAGVEVELRQTLWQFVARLNKEGCTVLLTTHYLEEAEALADRVVVVDGGRVVAQGSVQSIRAHVVQRRIRCSSMLDADAIARWPGVRSAVRNEGRIEIVADAAEAVVRRLLAEDTALEDLEVERAGLADAFVALTRNQNEDAIVHKEAA